MSNLSDDWKAETAFERNRLREMRAWLAEPGLRPVPTRAKAPHVFGGEVMKMPACRCGHEMRAWFTLDPRKVRSLAKLLPRPGTNRPRR